MTYVKMKTKASPACDFTYVIKQPLIFFEPAEYVFYPFLSGIIA